MAKTKKETTFLVSSAGTAAHYSYPKNRRKAKGEKKLSLKKYDPVLRKHVVFEERKLSKLKRKKAPAQAAPETKTAA